ncbi:16557_t:CDS:2, partial [Acaulospora colombiana]
MSTLYILNPLEQFELVNLVSIQAPVLGYYELGVTNLGLFLVIQLALVITGLVICYNPAWVARVNTWVVFFESLYGFLVNLLLSQLGLAGLNFTSTAHFALAIGLSCTVLIGVTYLGLAVHGLAFFRLFVPAGTPLALVHLLVVIESISYLARAVSLGLRLSANMLSGHVLLNLISTFSWKFITGSIFGLLLAPLPLLLLTLLFGLELGVA